MSAASNPLPLSVEAHRDSWMSVPDAMRALGETRYRVMRRGLTGELTIRTFAGLQLVYRESVDRVLAGKNAPAKR